MYSCALLVTAETEGKVEGIGTGKVILGFQGLYMRSPLFVKG